MPHFLDSSGSGGGSTRHHVQFRMRMRHSCLSQVSLSNEGLRRGTGVESVYDTAWCRQKYSSPDRQALKSPRHSMDKAGTCFLAKPSAVGGLQGHPEDRTSVTSPHVSAPWAAMTTFAFNYSAGRMKEVILHRRRNTRKLKGFLTLQGDLLI